MRYEHLSLEERHYIAIELKKSISINKISKALGRSQGTISKEIQRNTGKRGYRYEQANSLALNRRKCKQKPSKMTAEMKVNIDEMLIKNQWSPEQIAGRLKVEKKPLIAPRNHLSLSHVKQGKWRAFV